MSQSSQDWFSWEVVGHCVRTKTSRNERGGMTGGHLIAECSVHWTPDVVRSHALLIAAAPDMLAALVKIRDDAYDQPTTDELAALIERACQQQASTLESKS